jgi:hypothetical protein
MTLVAPAFMPDMLALAPDAVLEEGCTEKRKSRRGNRRL